MKYLLVIVIQIFSEELVKIKLDKDVIYYKATLQKPQMIWAMALEQQ